MVIIILIAEKSYTYGALTRTVGKTFSSLRYGDTDLVSITLCVLLLCAGTESRPQMTTIHASNEWKII